MNEYSKLKEEHKIDEYITKLFELQRNCPHENITDWIPVNPVANPEGYREKHCKYCGFVIATLHSQEFETRL